MTNRPYKQLTFISGFLVLLIAALQNCSPSSPFKINEQTPPSFDQSPDVSSGTLTERTNQDSSVLRTYALYSPTRIRFNQTEKLFVGGWIHPDDWGKNYFDLINNGGKPENIFGPDKIWLVENPTPNLYNNVTNLKLGFALKGYHINDPTIVAPPSDNNVNRSSWLYMYFTMLDNRIAENCRQAGQELIRCLIPLHDIGMAVSTNGGTTWNFVAKIVDHTQPPFSNDGGGWTPSVFVDTDGQISLYYASGSTKFDAPLLRRIRLSVNGWERLSEPVIAQTIDFANHTDFVYTNPDVKRLNFGNLSFPDWRYLLIYNNAAQNKILMASSKNGITFGKTVILRESNSSALLTPNIISASVLNGQTTLVYDFAERVPEQNSFVIKQAFWRN